MIFVNRVYWPSTAATAQLLTDLAEGLAAQGWPVHVIAAGESSTRHRGVTIHRTGDTDRHDGLLSRTLNYARFRRDARQRLADLIQPGDTVVVMTDPPMIGAALAATVAERGAALIHWIQDIYPEIVTAHVGAFAALPLAPWRARRDAAWRSAARCVTLGEDMAGMVASRRVPAERIAVLPNWAPRELDAAAPAAAVAARRAAWGVDGKFVVVYSGNLGRVHEFATGLDAAEILRPQTDIVFLFIGAGARFAEVQAAARARRLDNVRLLPPEPRAGLAAALAAADVHLVTLKPAFASLVYPSKLAGVLAAGRPVLFVGPSGGEIARLLAREGCGAAMNAGESSLLAGTIGEWQADRAACAERGRRARDVHQRRFTFAAALVAWESLLRQLAGRP